ncbi:MAG TPA: IMP cyclohydrolase [Candidatus Paceibacterota bacterium]|nr:IMP cyclohydrolase [Candidatus Paceibacterota bacterium]
MDPDFVAKINLSRLVDNPYPGRGLIVGREKSGKKLVQVYWIMGRSENSRNRVFSSDKGRVFTEAADPAKVNDPSLIIYNAMQEFSLVHKHYVVSNGAQTDGVVESLGGPPYLNCALSRWSHEPDEPNYTPRITALTSIGRFGSFIQMSIIRKSVFDGRSDHAMYEYQSIAPGFGFCLTTYSGDGNPLPAFRGEPLLMPLEGGIEEIAGTYWGALNEGNRVSLVVKIIEDTPDAKSSVRIINKYKKI